MMKKMINKLEATVERDKKCNVDEREKKNGL